MQASLLTRNLNTSLPQLPTTNSSGTNTTAACPVAGTSTTNTSTAAGHRHHRHLLRSTPDPQAVSPDTDSSEHRDLPQNAHLLRRQLGGMPFAEAYINAPGEQGRDADGACPMFPRDHAWHMDVRALPLHPNGDALRARIGGGGLHPDFGGGYGSGATRVLYGIPFLVVDSSRGTQLVKVGASCSERAFMRTHFTSMPISISRLSYTSPHCETTHFATHVEHGTEHPSPRLCPLTPRSTSARTGTLVSRIGAPPPPSPFRPTHPWRAPTPTARTPRAAVTATSWWLTTPRACCTRRGGGGRRLRLRQCVSWA